MLLRKIPLNIILAVIITLAIIIIFGIPFTQWWFTGDDFHGIFLGYKTKTWTDLLSFFSDGHTNQGAGVPGGYVLGKPSFLGAYYRPLYCVYLTLQFWCFGTNGYGYFLCNITAHALATGLLFYLFSRYTSHWTAGLGALLFAFHPQIAYRFGAVVNFHYYVNVVLILCIALALLHYLDRAKPSAIKPSSAVFPAQAGTQFSLLLALFLYALSLLTRETTLILPAIIGILLLARSVALKLPINWKQIITITFLFGAVAVAFLGLRLWLYPLAKISSSGVLFPYAAKGSFATLKFQEFLVFFYDLLFVSWLPWGNRILKIILLAPLLALLGYTFIRNRQKLLVIAFFVSGILMLWPGIISFYSPRYMYEALPFFIAGFVALFTRSNLTFPSSVIPLPSLMRDEPGPSPIPRLKTILKLQISTSALLLGIFTITSFQAREKKLHAMHQAVTNLCADPYIAQQALYFLTVPSDGFGFNPQIFWIMFNNRDYPVYFDMALMLTQQDSNIVKPGRWFNAIAPYYDTNYVAVVPTTQGFIFQSLDDKKFIFDQTDHQRSQKIGALEVLQQNHAGDATEIRLTIDDAIWQQQPLFINWNYETMSFDVVDRF